MQEPAETQRCKNCNQDIPVNNWSMHTIHCERHLSRCPHCKQPVNKKQLEEHIEENHAKVKCDECKEVIEKGKLGSHKEKNCKHRSVECPYCELQLNASDMIEHKDACGCRTELCKACGARVMNKDRERHEISECGKPRKQQVTQPPRNHKVKSMQTTSNEAFSGRCNDINRFLRFFPPQEQAFKARNSSGDSVKVTSDHIVEKPSGEPVQDTHVKKPMNNRRKNIPNLDNQPNVRTSAHRKSKKTPRKYYQTYEDVEGEFPGHDLTDDTFLPCECCGTLLPADALSFHQALCIEEKSFSTPRQQHRKKSAQKFPSEEDRSVQERPSLNNLKLYGSPKLDQATAVSSSSATRKNFDEETAPCEFCLKPIPLYQLGVHQVMCQGNENSEVSEPSPRQTNHQPTHNSPSKALKTTGRKSNLAIRFGDGGSEGNEQPVSGKTQIKALEELVDCKILEERSQEREITHKQSQNRKQTVQRPQKTDVSRQNYPAGDGVGYGKNATTTSESHVERVRKAHDARRIQNGNHNYKRSPSSNGGSYRGGNPHRRGTPQNRGGPNNRGNSRGGTRNNSGGSSTITVNKPPSNRGGRSEDSQAYSSATGVTVSKPKGKIVTLDAVVKSSNPGEHSHVMGLQGIGLNGTSGQYGYNNMGHGPGRRLGGPPRGGRGNFRGRGARRGGSRPRGGGPRTGPSY